MEAANEGGNLLDITPGHTNFPTVHLEDAQTVITYNHVRRINKGQHLQNQAEIKDVNGENEDENS